MVQISKFTVGQWVLQLLIALLIAVSLGMLLVGLAEGSVWAGFGLVCLITASLSQVALLGSARES